jgi:hypothetical protein
VPDLSGVFDALGDGVQAQGAGQIDHRLGHGVSGRTVGQVQDETTVQFQDVNRQPGQVLQ